MVIADAVSPGWLHTAAQIAGTVLLFELLIALLIFAALTVGLALAMWWLRKHVVPVVQQRAPQVQRTMDVATQGGERIVRGVAEFYGRQEMVKAMVRQFLYGSPEPPRPPSHPLTTPTGTMNGHGHA